MKLTKEEKRILIDACLSEMNSLNSYKNYKHVNKSKLEKHQSILMHLIDKLGE